MTRYEEVGSTNDEALARIRSGSAAAGDVIVARRQTAGRGRQGRNWHSDAGGLWLTAVLPAQEPLAGTGLAVGVAVCGAVAHFGTEPRLKWPNDVELFGRKLCGILVEHVAGWPLVAAGVGVNVANPIEMRPDLRQPAVSLSRVLGRPIEPEELLDPLLAALAEIWSSWGGQGWAAVMGEVVRWDGSVGRRVRASDGAWEGTAESLDPAGALLVRLDDGALRRVDAGEVDFV